MANDILERLLKRQNALKERIECEKAAQAQSEKNLKRRTAEVIGESIVREAEQHPEFKLMISQVLDSAVTDDASRKFLSGRGWL